MSTEYVGPPDAAGEFVLRDVTVVDVADTGVPLLAGTGAGGAGWVIPGFALHDEFDLLAAAGLAPLPILQAATSAPAR